MKSIVTIIALCVLMAGCTGKTCNQGPVGNEPVAQVGDTLITADQLQKEALGQLKKFDGEIYKIKKGILDQMIEKKIFAEAATKENLSVDAYLKKNIDDKITKPTDDEMKALFESNKGKSSKSFKDIKPQIEAYMIRSQKMALRSELLSRLKKDAKVKIMLEPPRVKISGIKNAPSTGSSSAKITIVEFSDYECPYCNRVRETIWKVVDKYGDQINYVFMDFPLSFHKKAQKAHEAAHCADDQGKYF